MKVTIMNMVGKISIRLNYDLRTRCVDMDNAQQFLQKRLFGIPFPREQRREAKEKYEERFENMKLSLEFE